MPDSSIYLTIRRLSPTLTNGRQFIQYCAWRISSALQYDNDDFFFNTRQKSAVQNDDIFAHYYYIVRYKDDIRGSTPRIPSHFFTTGFPFRLQVFLHKFPMHIRCITLAVRFRFYNSQLLLLHRFDSGTIFQQQYLFISYQCIFDA
jgi:hypothetical protein